MNHNIDDKNKIEHKEITTANTKYLFDLFKDAEALDHV